METVSDRPVAVSPLASAPRADGAALARGLGWFGIALGITELAAPRFVARAVGVRSDRRAAWFVRAFGAREIIAGVSVLLRPRRPAPMWGRVAGDVLDAALLSIAARTRRRSGARVAGALAAVAGAGVLDVIATRRVHRASVAPKPPITFAVTIARPPGEVYMFYRQLEQLPQFMEHIESVTELTDTTSHWVARMPGGATIEWDAEVVEDIPGERIAWRSVPGAPYDMRGEVTFQRTPGRDHTEVHVEMQVGGLGRLARYFAKPQLKADLRRLKQVLETGEVLRAGDVP